MTTTNVTLHYGHFVGICQICFKDRKRFGTLVDPNGHSWLICAPCINGLWEDSQALNQEEAAKGRQDDAIETVIERLRTILKGDEDEGH